MAQTLTSGHLRYVQHHNQFPETKWYFGADLGQRLDYSALAVLELSWTAHGRCPVNFAFLFEPKLHIRSLQRFPKGISYEKFYNIVQDSLDTFGPPFWNQPSVGRELIIDAGGPGPPLVDRLRANLSRTRVNIKPVLLTSGKGDSSLHNGYTGVPRRTILTILSLLIDAKSVQCKREVEGFDTLRQELLELTAGSSHPSGGNAHDDLTIATGLAAWAASRDFPELLPETDPIQSCRRDFFGPDRLF